jgi:hypothetical protein
MGPMPMMIHVIVVLLLFQFSMFATGSAVCVCRQGEHKHNVHQLGERQFTEEKSLYHSVKIIMVRIHVSGVISTKLA